MKSYCVVYLSPGRAHYRYRCLARTKREAKSICKSALGISNADIVDVYEE